MDSRSLIFIGTVIIFFGFFLVSAGIILSSILEGGSSKVEGGGIVMIGPIPIAFGTSTETVIIAMMLGVLLIALWIFGNILIK